MTNRKGHTYSKKIYCLANLIDIVQLFKTSLQTFQHLTDASTEQQNNRAWKIKTGTLLQKAIHLYPENSLSLSLSDHDHLALPLAWVCNLLALSPAYALQHPCFLNH